MPRKLLIGIGAGLGIALTIFIPIPMGVLAIATWIYLVIMIRKKGAGIFLDTNESNLAQRNFKRLKVSLVFSVILFFISITSIVLHNTLDNHSQNHVSIFFYLSLGAMSLFILATAGAMFVFLKAQGKI